MYHLNVTFLPPKSSIPVRVICRLFFFAVCNNLPVRVIGRAGKRPEIMVHVKGNINRGNNCNFIKSILLQAQDTFIPNLPHA